MSRSKVYFSNIYNVIFKRKKKDLIKLFLISTPGSLAAFFEGITFGLLLCSLYILNGQGINALLGRPILSKLTRFAFLQHLSTSKLFILMVIAAIGAQVLKSLIIYISSVYAAKLNARIACEVHKNIYS